MATLRIPPGRAGRLWLRERLDSAESALSLLQRKQAILDQRLRELRARGEQTGRDWAGACELARTWQQRAALLGGARSITTAAPRTLAEIRFGSEVLAGVRYPGTVECVLPPDLTVATSATLVHARTAHGAALIAAAHHGAALAAVRAVERELAATRVRAQALRHRRVPALQAALAELDLTLEERERAERIPLLRRTGLR